MTTGLSIVFFWWLYPAMRITEFVKGEEAAYELFDRVDAYTGKALDFIFNHLLYGIAS